MDTAMKNQDRANIAPLIGSIPVVHPTTTQVPPLALENGGVNAELVLARLAVTTLIVSKLIYTLRQGVTLASVRFLQMSAQGVPLASTRKAWHVTSIHRRDTDVPLQDHYHVIVIALHHWRQTASMDAQQPLQSVSLKGWLKLLALPRWL